MTFEQAAKTIKKAKRIAIATHVNPDGDALGSMFALKAALSKFAKKIDLFADGKITPYLTNLFNTEEISTAHYAEENYDLVLIVDLPTPSRLGAFHEIADHKNIIKIDHHLNNEKEVFLNNIIESDSASTSELIYLLIQALKVKITPEIASYLYTGIATDTNSFVNFNTTARSMKIASELLELGAEVGKINQFCFKSKSKEEWKLAQIFYDKAEIHSDYAIVSITAKDLKRCGDDNVDTGHFANMLASISGVKIGCSITNRGIKTWRCSFRSLPDYNVSEIATKMGGGGHKCASGCTLSGPEKKVKAQIESAIKDYLSKHRGET